MTQLASSTSSVIVDFPSSSSSSEGGSPQIRHAGRAHIRGKIRRVWRPRYLELWDNGLVRYYELPVTETGLQQSSQDSQHVNMLPKYILAIYSARILDVTTLRDIHVGLPRACFGFLFRGQRLLHLENPSKTSSSCQPQDMVKEQRDFLCAVASLEEAQMWVVALQWAASQQQASPTLEPWWQPDLATWEDVSTEHSLSRMGESSIFSLPSTPQRAGDAAKSTPLQRPHGAGEVRTMHQQQSPAPVSGATAGKVVVSKVVQYRTVRLPGWYNFEIAYEIHGMLLKHRQAEHWSMLRTADDFTRLVSNLCKELGPSLLDRAQVGPMRQLPRLRDRPTSTRLQASLSAVDSILRSLVMDPDMVNAHAMKVFLGLLADTPVQKSSPSYWKLHNPRAVLQRGRVSLPDNYGSPDQYVKVWLQRRSAVKQSMWEAQSAALLQRPLVVLGGLGLSTVALLPLSRLWESCWPIVSVRLDVLLASWVGAAFLGSRMGTSRHAPPTSTSRSQQRREERHVAPKRPTAQSPVLKPTSAVTGESPDSPVIVRDDADDVVSTSSPLGDPDDQDYESDGETQGNDSTTFDETLLSSPLPEFPGNDGYSCWSRPPHNVFYVRGSTYLKDRVKIPSGQAPLTCRGVDLWMTDNPERHIARHPAVLGGKLGDEDTFMVNFLLPFANFVAYFSVPPLEQFPDKLRSVWTNFLAGDQQYRDARLKLLPVVIDGPWIVKAAVGPGKSPALLGKVIPLQYFFRQPTKDQKGVYEVDVIITASTIAKGILSVVKGHTKSVTIGFAFIIEAAKQEELPENVLCAFQVHSLHLEDCPALPPCDLDEVQA